MNKNLLIASGIAGGSIGGFFGSLNESEKSEQRGEGYLKQMGGLAYGGLSGGIKGTAAGVGISGTAIAIKSILKK